MSITIKFGAGNSLTADNGILSDVITERIKTGLALPAGGTEYSINGVVVGSDYHASNGEVVDVVQKLQVKG